MSLISPEEDLNESNKNEVQAIIKEEGKSPECCTGNISNSDLHKIVQIENVDKHVSKDCVDDKHVSKECNDSSIMVEPAQESVRVENVNISNDTQDHKINGHSVDEQESTGSTDKIMQNTLVHKVNELAISEETDKSTSNVIVKKQTDSLKNLLVYDSSSDDEDNETKTNVILSGSSDSESDSLSEDSSSDEDTDDFSSEIVFDHDKSIIKKPTPQNNDVLKVPGEFDLSNLPPVPDPATLKINVEKEEFLHMGHVQAVIDTLVTVEAIPGTPAYDLDSFLFIDDKTTKKALGAIFDVIGPVTSPIYCIRFNTTKDIEDCNIKQGMKVYSAPKSNYTHYVFVKELMKIKGTDASWIDDNELPPEMAESSDEEGSVSIRDSRKAQKRKHNSLERYKEYEESMNRCNTLNTRVAQLVDARMNAPRRQSQNVNYYANGFPVPFDPTIPPPGFHNNYRRHDSHRRRPMHWSGMVHQATQWRPSALSYHNFDKDYAAGPSK